VRKFIFSDLDSGSALNCSSNSPMMDKHNRVDRNGEEQEGSGIEERGIGREKNRMRERYVRRVTGRKGKKKDGIQ
jgi:hypothetical protein